MSQCLYDKSDFEMIVYLLFNILIRCQSSEELLIH